jgi:hypothetical protein
MVNPTITDFQQDVNGDIKMLKLGVDQEDAYANIIGQAEGADLDNNKTATINVSTYTEPVEIKPTAGKDGMKKATITLSNIPSGVAYAWKADSDDYIYFNNSTSPQDLAEFNTWKELTGSMYGGLTVSNVVEPLTTTFTRTSDTEFVLTDGGGEYTYTRDTTKDIALW